MISMIEFNEKIFYSGMYDSVFEVLVPSCIGHSYSEVARQCDTLSAKSR